MYIFTEHQRDDGDINLLAGREVSQIEGMSALSPWDDPAGSPSYKSKVVTGFLERELHWEQLPALPQVMWE